MSEERVSIATLKAHLSEYLRKAKAGTGLVVTDRGTPIARLGPLEGADALTGHARDLARAGLVRSPVRRLDHRFMDSPRPADPDGRSLETVLEERGEGW